MQQIWLMIAFAPAPGFRPAENGKSWCRTFRTRNAAIASKRVLVAAGIRYLCKKVPAKPDGKPRGKRPFKPWRQPACTESEGLRAARDRQFAEYRREMAQPLELTQPLPEPKDGPTFGRSPGLSKGAPARLGR